jgi:LCP family protein required for cell wall assembly
VLLALACLATAGGLALFRQKLSEVPRVAVGVALAPKVGDDSPRNILIIGTDNADRLGASDPIREQRPRGELLADVIMIVRLEPKAKRASLLSIPRDTWVPIAPFGNKGKINSAIAGPNGPQNLITTIKRNFGISIDNYVEVDFQGFRSLVGALGGVPVYLNVPVRDTHTGLLLTHTGCVVLDEVQGLAYARSRHLQYLDPKTHTWKSDLSSDLGRISRQQDFIERAAQRAVDRGARNPATAFSLIDAAVHAITIDQSMTVGQLRDLADQFGNFNVKDLQKYQLPTASGPSKVVSYQVVETEQAEPILDVFRGLVYGAEVTPRNVQVEVGPTGGDRDSTAVATDLDARGFDADALTTGRPSGAAVTTIRYGARGRVAAGVLARWLDATVRYVYDPKLPGARLHLDPGSGFRGVRTDPLPADAVETPSLASATTTTMEGYRTTTTAGPGSATSGTGAGEEAPPATTTTAPGLVPTDSDAAERCG